MWTKRGSGIGCILILLLLLAWYIQVRIMYALSSVALSLIVISFLLSRFELRRLNCSRNIDDTAVEDEVINVELSVENNSLFSRDFFQFIDFFTAGPPQEVERSTFIVGLKRKTTFKWPYEAACFKRGLYPIGPCKIVASDPLGIFPVCRELKVFSKLLVYPKMFNIRYFPILLKGMTPRFGGETTRTSGNYEEFYGIREYHEEDGLRKIHWRSTARLGKLMVKHFEQIASYQVTILLDLYEGHDIGSGKETTLEYSVKIAASVARYLINRGALVQLVAHGSEFIMLPFGKDRPHFFQILESLATVQADGAFTLADVLNKFNFAIPANSTLIVIMLDIDHGVMKSLEQLKTKGVSVIQFVLLSSTFAFIPESIGLARERKEIPPNAISGVETRTYYISQGADLEEVFEEPVK